MVNLIPNNDDREHAHDVYCWCEPRVEYYHPDTGVEHRNGPFIAHHSADGRETVERLLGEKLAPDKNWTLWKTVTD